MKGKLDDNWIPLGVAVRAAISRLGDDPNINRRQEQSDMSTTDPIADMFLVAWGWPSAEEVRRRAAARDKAGGPITAAQEAVINAARAAEKVRQIVKAEIEAEK